MPITQDQSEPPFTISSGISPVAQCLPFKPPGSTQLLASVTCTSATGTPAISVFDSGGRTWTPKISASSPQLWCGMFTAQVTTAPGSPMTVTARDTSGNNSTVMLNVHVLPGVSSNQTGAGTASAAPGQPATFLSFPLTTTVRGSWEYWCGVGAAQEAGITYYPNMIQHVDYQDPALYSTHLAGRWNSTAAQLPVTAISLDCARRTYSVGFVQNLLAAMSRYGFNMLHLHLTDNEGWNIECSTVPGIVGAGAFTKAQITSLIAYAAGLGITVMPEFELLGHVGKLVSGTYASLGVNSAYGGKSLDISQSGALTLAQAILAEYLPLFPSGHWHLSGDEWMSTADLAANPQLLTAARARFGGSANERDLQYWFMNQLAAQVIAAGKTAPRMWDDQVVYPFNIVVPDQRIIIEVWQGNSSSTALAAFGYLLSNSNINYLFCYTNGGLYPTAASLAGFTENLYPAGSWLGIGPNQIVTLGYTGISMPVWSDFGDTTTEAAIQTALGSAMAVIAAQFGTPAVAWSPLPGTLGIGWTGSSPTFWAGCALEIIPADVLVSSSDSGVGSDFAQPLVKVWLPAADAGTGGEYRNAPTGPGATLFFSSADGGTSLDNVAGNLSDAFTGTSLNTALWGVFGLGTATVSGGVLTLTDVASVVAYIGIESVATYSLVNSQFQVQLVSDSAALPGGTTAQNTQTFLQVVDPAGNRLGLIVAYTSATVSSLVAQQVVNGVQSFPANTVYLASAMAFLRIREASRTVYFEYASAQAGPWSVLWSGPEPFPLNAIRLILSQGMYAATDPQTNSKWDAVNLPAAPVQESVPLTWQVRGDADFGTGTDTSAGPPLVRLTGRESASGSEGNSVPYTYTSISSIVLGYAQEGFSLARCAVLNGSTGAESAHVYGAQSISLVPNVTASDMRADDDEYGTWYTLNKAALTVTNGFLPFKLIAQLGGTTVASSGTSPSDYYGLPLWTQYQHNKPSVPMAFRMTGRNSNGSVRTLSFVLYKVQLSVLDFTGMVYKDGLGVSYAGTVLFSGTDERGNTLAGPEIGRIVSVPGSQAGVFGPVQFAGI